MSSVPASTARAPWLAIAKRGWNGVPSGRWDGGGVEGNCASRIAGP